jgi:AcrR family transcriptional regulator
MKNKEIQEKRMKEYFIQATKEILKSEGLQALSVRNIADRAGYSYATLYNYFKDVNDLIFLCVKDFQEECISFVVGQTKKKTKGIEKLKSSILAYINYFVEYPGIFDLFYITKIGDLGNKQTTIDLISKSLDDVCQQDWDYCITHNLVPIEKVENLKSQLRFSLVGILLFYINRRTPVDYAEFVNKSINSIDYLFEINNCEVLSNNIQNEVLKVQNSIISVNIS